MSKKLYERAHKLSAKALIHVEPCAFTNTREMSAPDEGADRASRPNGNAYDHTLWGTEERPSPP